MIKETPVLHERPIVRMGKHADLCICENKAAHQIGLQITLDCDSQGFLHQTAPRLARNLIDIEPPPHLFLRYQRLEHRAPDVPGKDT